MHGWWDVLIVIFLSLLFSHSDPFDLNHNLGAGLSRKSKLHLFVNFVQSPVPVTIATEFLLFSLQ